MIGWMRRIRRWWWLRRHGTPGQKGLREFVYLDDTSVYSLLASRGPVATGFTATETFTAATESSDRITLNTGPLKADAGGRTSASRTSGSEIVRQSSAQARFTQLLRQEDDQVLIRSAPRRKRPKPSSLSDLVALSNDGRHSDWVTDVSALGRGEVVEIDVRLGAEALYRVSQTIESITGIVSQDPAAFGLAGDEGFKQAELLSKVLDGLLAQLVPVRGVATDLCCVTADERDLLVRRELIEAFEDGVCRRPPTCIWLPSPTSPSTGRTFVGSCSRMRSTQCSPGLRSTECLMPGTLCCLRT